MTSTHTSPRRARPARFAIAIRARASPSGKKNRVAATGRIVPAPPPDHFHHGRLTTPPRTRSRLALVATTFALAACAARSPTRATVATCVERADAERRDCLRDCEGAFGDALIACHGGPNDCTGRCQTTLAACQAGPVEQLRFCGEAPENTASCRARLRADRAACRGRADAAACEEDARRHAAACWQACERASRPDLGRCASGFRQCLAACVPRD